MLLYEAPSVISPGNVSSSSNLLSRTCGWFKSDMSTMSLSRRCSIFLSKSRDFLCQGCPSSLDVILITAALCRAVHMLGVNPSLLWKLLSSIMTGGSLAASREIWSRDLGRGWALAKQMLLSEAECWMWWCRCSDTPSRWHVEGEKRGRRTANVYQNRRYFTECVEKGHFSVTERHLQTFGGDSCHSKIWLHW